MGLRDRFRDAGLDLIEARKPFLSSNEDVFQFDIKRTVSKKKRRTEIFRVFTGHDDNQVQVVNTDKKLHQLILMVREPPRKFDRNLSYTEVKRAKDDAKAEGISLREMLKKLFPKAHRIQVTGAERSFGTNVVVGETTPGDKRHFLCGLDERQLFVAQLRRGVSTVSAAHRELQATDLTTADGKARGKTIRQGEWFFVPCSPAQCKRIDDALTTGTAICNKDTRIDTRGRGNPHMVKERVQMPEKKLRGGGEVLRRQEIYIRGPVRHVDHKTVKLRKWHRVLRNNEQGSTNDWATTGTQQGMRGVGYID